MGNIGPHNGHIWLHGGGLPGNMTSAPFEMSGVRQLQGLQSIRASDAGMLLAVYLHLYAHDGEITQIHFCAQDVRV